MANRFTFPRETALDANGDPISGAKLNFYTSGTTERLDTFSDNALTVANANPVVADSAGRFGNIFLQASNYKVVLTDAADATIWTADPVAGTTDTTGDDFAPGQQSTPDMTVLLAAGTLYDIVSKTIVTKTAQTSPVITAPSTNPRKDIVYIDRLTGVVGIDTGAEAASPVDPTISDDKLPVARVTLATTTTEITDSLIDDIRELNLRGAGDLARFDTVSGSLIAMGSDAQGDILYRNATVYARLPAGTSGQYLQTQGAAANPQWSDVPSITSVYEFTDTTNTSIATLTSGGGVLWSSSQSITIPTSGVIRIIPYIAITNSSGATKFYSVGLNINSTAYFPQINDGGSNPFALFSVATATTTTLQGLGEHGSTYYPLHYVFDIEGYGISTGSQTVQPIIGTDNVTATQTLVGATTTCRLKVIIEDFS